MFQLDTCILLISNDVFLFIFSLRSNWAMSVFQKNKMKIFLTKRITYVQPWLVSCDGRIRLQFKANPSHFERL